MSFKNVTSFIRIVVKFGVDDKRTSAVLLCEVENGGPYSPWPDRKNTTAVLKPSNEMQGRLPNALTVEPRTDGIKDSRWEKLFSSS